MVDGDGLPVIGTSSAPSKCEHGRAGGGRSPDAQPDRIAVRSRRRPGGTLASGRQSSVYLLRAFRRRARLSVCRLASGRRL